MNKSDLIRKHWENMSNDFGTDLKSTTKTSTIKKLEIYALSQALSYICEQKINIKNVLEFGCGNGHNCNALSKSFGDIHFTGVDYIPNMIRNAKKIVEIEKLDNLQYFIGDVLNMNETELLLEYDVVFTDRCLINLDSTEKQRQAISNLAGKVVAEGYLILIENITQTYSNQNSCRKLIGLMERIPPEYNLFLDETLLLKWADELSLQLVDIHDFGSLHDLLLYVILPKINNGKIKYDDPVIDAVTDFCISTSTLTKNHFGNLGQNRLYLFRKG